MKKDATSYRHSQGIHDVDELLGILQDLKDAGYDRYELTIKRDEEMSGIFDRPSSTEDTMHIVGVKLEDDEEAVYDEEEDE